VANVNVYKGIIGRILNFGDINVLGFKDEISMEGIRDPEVFYRIINNKIAVMRGTAQKSSSKEEFDGQKVISTDWRSDQKDLEKRVPAMKLKSRMSRRSSASDIFGFLNSFKPAKDEESAVEEGDADFDDTEDMEDIDAAADIGVMDEVEEMEDEQPPAPKKKRKRRKRKKKTKTKEKRGKDS
jgi:hypothetical protein